MTQVLVLLFSAAFTYAVSLGAGSMLLGALRVKLYRSEQRFFGFVIGSALLSTAVFALTAAHLAYTGVFLAAGLATVAVALWQNAYRTSAEALPPLDRPWRITFGVLYAIFALLYLGNALMPETSPDARLYHMALPARYLREHDFPANGRNMMANLTESIEMLFLFGYALGKHSAGAMVHLVFTLVMPFGMLSWGKRAGLPAAGAAGALLFFLSPIVGRLGSCGYIDVAVACVVFAVFYLLEIWRQGQPDRLLIAVGLLAGFCFAAKYTAGIAVPYAIAVILVHRRREPLRQLWKPVFVAGLFAALMMTPYLIKNTVVTGNPLAPFFNRVFPNPAMTVSLEQSYSYAMRYHNGVSLQQIPLEVTIHGGALQGIVGPVFLLLPLALLAWRYPAGRAALLAAAVFTLPYFASIATRFLVPALTFLSLALAAALGRWKPVLWGLVMIHAVLSWPPVVDRYCSSCWQMPIPEIRYALRLRPADELLRQYLDDWYPMDLAIERNVPEGEPIFSYDGFDQLYQSHEIVVGWQSTLGNRLAKALETPVDPPLLPKWRHDYQLSRRTPVRRIRLLQQSSSREEQWSVTEVRIFRDGAELPRKPEWRLKAWPNPWEVQLAFDNNPATRWSSGQSMRPGMWIEVDLGNEENIDRVLVELTNDQPSSRMRLESSNSTGEWSELKAEVAIYRAPSPAGLKRAATAFLRLNRFHWLLINNSNVIANDMASRPDDWGVRRVAAEGNWRLYVLQDAP